MFDLVTFFGAHSGAAMQLPSLKDFPPEVAAKEIGRAMEAILAGLRSDPPNSFAGDWQESVDEAERLLREVEDQPSG